ncbi:hypothetical protein [Morganella morganii]|uniref:nSTAND3 domain-containing NTPase n=1 Tax=Morganella morganii TaxID=582 RepID=UPI003CD0C453
MKHPLRKQFFYFDNFLGATLLEIFTKNSDSKIVQFIKKIITAKHDCKVSLPFLYQ